jgi:Na+-translocating ferredoxin:NAD+ oxidoreductase RnfG subunit
VIDIHNRADHARGLHGGADAGGSVRSVRVLAFTSPRLPLPNDRWYAQFDEKSLESPLRLGGDIHGVVGATLSARATTRGVRRALAFYQVLVRNEP